MAASHRHSLLHHHRLLPFVLFFFFLFIATAQALTGSRPLNNSVTAVLVFGDSTVDPGNNNYLKTIVKSNFPPYGQDFANEQPTGRFCNGRLATDFIASYVGVKDFVPPYLDPTLSIEELMTGVSFASAGTGFDPLTSTISVHFSSSTSPNMLDCNLFGLWQRLNVIPMTRELEYLKEYRQRIEAAIGKKRTQNHIKKSLFVISCGTNDFVITYFILQLRQKTFTIEQYQQFILQKIKEFVQGLVEQGARRISFTGLTPMGCLPVVITLFSENAVLDRGCIDYYSSIGRSFNAMLLNEINALNIQWAKLGVKIFYNDAYQSLSSVIQGPRKTAFDEVNAGCCGTGYLETSYLCNPKSYVCPDARKYVFWDAIHPTEQTYYTCFKDYIPTLNLLIA